ncbi:hypothetical protein ABZ611_14485 [Streptomyces sp. NPDC007861]|uniref:hypothetical protein n=1 Tax=Streptomyces sp. NPDC007861 TaxID=3154893 RepID=UPI0033CD5453
MGIESDQLVFDYLSRVGDLAQQRQLPSGTRMRLVSSLRNEIDRQRAKYDTDTPAAVHRILGRLGTPDEVVAAAADGGGGDGAPAGRASAPRAPSVPSAAVPEQRISSAASPPHLAGMDELGPSGGEPDWWRIGPGGPGEGGDGIGGFVGGVEIAEILRPPPRKEADGQPEKGEASEASEETEERDGLDTAEDDGEAPERRRLLPGRLGNPVLLTAAALLAVGTVLGSWLALALGWLVAYGSRSLSRTEAKWGVLGLPVAVVVGTGVWFWGRVNGKWGEPIPAGGEAMGDALAGAWPWVVRGAAVATALYLVWRARRR